MINLTLIEQQALQTEPYEWAFINEIFNPASPSTMWSENDSAQLHKYAGKDENAEEHSFFVFKLKRD